MTPDLASYDLILINTSGGKDSQTQLRLIVAEAIEAGVTDRLVAVHCDLGRVEWPGTPQVAERQVATYLDGSIPFVKVSRPQGDLLDQVEQVFASRPHVPSWPSSQARYCTSDHKTSQVAKLMTALVTLQREAWVEHGQPVRPVRILDCLGIRAAESPARSKKAPFQQNVKASNTKRRVDTWLPIFTWTDAEVWADIEASGVEHHEAYDLGMPRLSCAFCVMGSKSSLVRAAQLLPELAQEYLAVEQRVGYTIQGSLSMAEVIEEAAASSEVAVELWAA